MSHSIRRCRAPAWLSVPNSELAPLGGACLGRVAALSTVLHSALAISFQAQRFYYQIVKMYQQDSMFYN